MNANKDNEYIRDKAVEYALNYALKPNPQFKYFSVYGDGGGDCSNFVSQCLLAGGAQMVHTGTRPWWYKTLDNSSRSDHRWSVSWSVANSLYWCLKTRGKLNLPGLKGIEVNHVDLLEIGDIIQYENSLGNIYHSAIITGFRGRGGMREPLISQHSYDAINISYIKPKAKRMHFMKIMI